MLRMRTAPFFCVPAPTMSATSCLPANRRDPEFRARFHQMCANIGVDPLASNKGVWAKTLGIGDFYYELGVQVVGVS